MSTTPANAVAPTRLIPRIKIGVGTILGVTVSVITLLPPLVMQIVALVENVSVHWGSGEKIALVTGAVTTAITLLGRFAQAVAHILTGKEA